MSARRRLALAAAIGLVVPVVWSPPAFAARSLAVAPITNLVEGQVVSVTGAGFRPSVRLALCQAIMDATPGPDNCGNVAKLVFSSSSGGFSTQYTVAQTETFINDRRVSCWIEQCFFLAAEVDRDGVPIPGTATFSAALTFVHVQPDAQIRRLSDGKVFGNNVYERFPSSLQTLTHQVTPGTDWSFAVQVQNDGARTEDITLKAAGRAVPGITVRYFVGWIDVTSQVTGAGGFTFAGVPPGVTRKMPVQFRASSSAQVGAKPRRLVTFTGGAPVKDTVLIGVDVAAP